MGPRKCGFVVPRSIDAFGSGALQSSVSNFCLLLACHCAECCISSISDELAYTDVSGKGSVPVTSLLASSFSTENLNNSIIN